MTTQPGIWKYAKQLKPFVKPKSRLTLNEGHTNLIKINNIYFKREDQNPTGSVKDRGMAYQISALLQKDFSSPLQRGRQRGSPLKNTNNLKFVISSSGNAAISAAAYCQKAQAELTIFVSPKIPKTKLQKLKTYPYKIIQTNRPISESHRFAKQNSAYNLRPSKDLLGPTGYQTIAYEIQNQLPNVEAIFFPVSSATTLMGVAEGYTGAEDGSQGISNNPTNPSHPPLSKGRGILPLGKGELEGVRRKPKSSLEIELPQLHAVQTTKIHPLASKFDKNFEPSNSSLATGLVAKIVPRKQNAINSISESHGSGWVVSDLQIQKAQDWLTKRGIKTSYEGATALAGYFKAVKNNVKFKNNVVCLLTGNL